MYSSDNEATSSELGQNSPPSPQGADIYPSLNSLLDGDRDQPSPDYELTQSITDMLGLNNPRGPFVSNTSLPQSPVGFGRRKFNASTPFHSATTPSNCHYKGGRVCHGFQRPSWINLDTIEDDNMASPSPVRSFHRSFDLGYYSTPNSPMVPRRQYYGQKYNDCSSSLTDSYLTSSLRSLSPPESMTNSSCMTDTSISEIMGSLSLQNNYHNPVMSAEQDFRGLSQSNPIQQLKLLQQQQMTMQASLCALLQQQQCAGSSMPKKSPSSVLGSNPMTIGDGNGNSLERAALFHRNAAAVYDATYTWSGSLPPRSEKNAVYSCKVFLGGVPWDLSEQTLEQVFHHFGPIRVEWPGKEQLASQPKGFVYIIFESEKKLRALLANCCKDFANGGSWFYKISSRRMKSKEVQVIPWAITDCNYARSTCHKLDPQKTVFVGALHGMITAEGLFKIMNDLFGSVIYAGIDTDKFKYPIGSARVTFNNNSSYMKAVAAAFIEIKTDKFSKKIQVDPYLEDAFCSSCKVQQGPYFCREMICFRYFCRTCWHWQHTLENMESHKPLMRNSKHAPIIGFGNHPPGSGPFD